MQTVRRPFVEHIDATAFAGNEVLSCHIVDICHEGVTLAADHPRATGEFVRVQGQLTQKHWLDVDAILRECSPEPEQWHWKLDFVSLTQQQRIAISDVLQQARIEAAWLRLTSAPTQPPPPPSRVGRHNPPSGVHRKLSDEASLWQLYAAARRSG